MNSKLKPWMFVTVTVEDPRVEQGRRRFVGETVSMPTPEGTIMVRAVPGEPGTAIEVPLKDVVPYNKKAVEVIFAKVSSPMPKNNEGQRRRFDGDDMLRYDSAVPWNFRVEEDEMGRGVAVLEEGHTDLVVARVPLGPRNWSKDRWASFWYKVEELHHMTKVIRRGA